MDVKHCFANSIFSMQGYVHERGTMLMFKLYNETLHVLYNETLVKGVEIRGVGKRQETPGMMTLPELFLLQGLEHLRKFNVGMK